ncbi:MAG: zinc ribbon domain-containing protein [Victivallaceae bacterium]|nr:zinc ribbon domain-containing protein [Victivallaceae bacterium]
MSTAFKCPKCQAPTWGDLKFCPECGEPLDIVCPECEFTIRYIQAANYKFCPKCGGKMQSRPEHSAKKGGTA